MGIRLRHIILSFACFVVLNASAQAPDNTEMRHINGVPHYVVVVQQGYTVYSLAKQLGVEVSALAPLSFLADGVSTGKSDSGIEFPEQIGS